jgi:hypothetical protein
MNCTPIYIFCLFVFTGFTLHSMERSYPLLNEESAKQLILVTAYHLELAKTGPNYSVTNPVVIASHRLLSITKDEENTESYAIKAQKLTQDPAIAPNIHLIWTRYQQDSECQDAFEIARLRTMLSLTQPNDNPDLSWNFCRKKMCLLAGKIVAENSTFRCPTEQGPDLAKNIENLLEMNTSARPEDAPVYIAGIYALYMFKQFREDAIQNINDRER